MKKILAIVSLVALMMLVAGCSAPVADDAMESDMAMGEDEMAEGVTHVDGPTDAASESETVATETVDVIDALGLDDLDALDSELDESALTLE